MSPSEARAHRVATHARKSNLTSAETARYDKADDKSKVKRHLAVVPAKPSRKIRPRAVAALSAVALIVVCFGLVVFNVVLAQRQFQIDKLQSQISDQQTSYQKLRLQVAQLEAPERIVSTAEGQLGMQQPASVTYLQAPPGGAVTGQSLSANAPYPSGDADWPTVKHDMAGNP